MLGRSGRKGSGRLRRTPTPRVEALEPRVVLASFLVTNGLDGGAGSFRDAILNANASPGPDVIGFDLGTVGNTIRVETNLPAVADALTISSPVRIAVTWVPTNAPVGFEALNVRADDVRVSSLSITGFEHAVFLHDGADRAVISDNYLGVGPDGGTAPGGMFHGVRIAASTSNLVENNVIAGCSRESIWVESPDASGNVIRGNKIGTNAAGTAALGNVSDGIHLGIGSHHNAVTENLISGNGRSGVRISDAFGFAAHHNVVERNRIGTDVTATLPLPNGDHGVAILGGAHGNTVGGRGAGTGNIIAFNTRGGVVVAGADATANAVVGNSIRSNGGLGIDLQGDGVTPNDPLDADNGPNGLVNFPVLSEAGPLADGSTRVQGVFDGQPSASFVLDFYASPPDGTPIRRDGARYLGSTTVATDLLGRGSFDATIPSPVAVGDSVTATATDATGSTSEFSTAIDADTPVMDPDPDECEGPHSLTEGDLGEIIGRAYRVDRSMAACGYSSSIEPPDGGRGDVDLFAIDLKMGEKLHIFVRDTFNDAGNDRRRGLQSAAFIFEPRGIDRDTGRRIFKKTGGAHQGREDVYEVTPNMAVTQDGPVYVGVSAAGNQRYNIETGRGATAGNRNLNRGPYTITFQIDPAPTPTPTPCELSGPQWVSRFPDSKSTSDLTEPFRTNTNRFLSALSDAGAMVHVETTFRPAERAYLQHYAWRIAREGFDPRQVPPREGVCIDWVHTDAAGRYDEDASRRAARRMVMGYNLVFRPSLTSRHIERRAIDMRITWQGTLSVVDGNGAVVQIATLPRNGGLNKRLHRVGESYGVIKFHIYGQDRPHWSDNGH